MTPLDPHQPSHSPMKSQPVPQPSGRRALTLVAAFALFAASTLIGLATSGCAGMNDGAVAPAHGVGPMQGGEHGGY